MLRGLPDVPRLEGVIVMDQAERPAIAGYRYGDPTLDPSPISVEELQRIQQALLFTEDDVQALGRVGPILERHLDELLDVWYGFVGRHDFLLRYFSDARGPLQGYLERVRKRFRQWVLDTTRAEFDERWLAYQYEIGRRHHLGKNATDGIAGAPDLIHFRYLAALIYPIYATVRPFLEREETDQAEVERMHQAWLKAVILSVILWSQPYLKPGTF